MSNRMGRVNVTPVDPAIKRAVSKAAKSEWEEPYGPSMSAMNFSCGVEPDSESEDEAET